MKTSTQGNSNKNTRERAVRSVPFSNEHDSVARVEIRSPGAFWEPVVRFEGTMSTYWPKVYYTPCYSALYGTLEFGLDGKVLTFGLHVNRCLNGDRKLYFFIHLGDDELAPKTNPLQYNGALTNWVHLSSRLKFEDNLGDDTSAPVRGIQLLPEMLSTTYESSGSRTRSIFHRKEITFKWLKDANGWNLFLGTEQVGYLRTSHGASTCSIGAEMYDGVTGRGTSDAYFPLEFGSTFNPEHGIDKCAYFRNVRSCWDDGNIDDLRSWHLCESKHGHSELFIKKERHTTNYSIATAGALTSAGLRSSKMKVLENYYLIGRRYTFNYGEDRTFSNDEADEWGPKC